jgi:hypothetical protein
MDEAEAWNPTPQIGKFKLCEGAGTNCFMYSMVMQLQGMDLRKSCGGRIAPLPAVFAVLWMLSLQPAYARAPQSPANSSQATEVTQPTAQDFFKQGNEASRHEKWDDAIAAYKKALALKPSYIEAHYNLGNAYAAEQKTSEALKEYREVLRLRPDFPGVHMNLGALEEAGGQIPEAIADLGTPTRIWIWRARLPPATPMPMPRQSIAGRLSLRRAMRKFTWHWPVLCCNRATLRGRGRSIARPSRSIPTVPTLTPVLPRR